MFLPKKKALGSEKIMAEYAKLKPVIEKSAR
jgi:hypothetical protein